MVFIVLCLVKIKLPLLRSWELISKGNSSLCHKVITIDFIFDHKISLLLSSTKDVNDPVQPNVRAYGGPSRWELTPTALAAMLWVWSQWGHWLEPKNRANQKPSYRPGVSFELSIKLCLELALPTCVSKFVYIMISQFFWRFSSF